MNDEKIHHPALLRFHEAAEQLAVSEATVWGMSKVDGYGGLRGMRERALLVGYPRSGSVGMFASGPLTSTGSRSRISLPGMRRDVHLGRGRHAARGRVR